MSYLNVEVNCTEPSPQLVFPGLDQRLQRDWSNVLDWKFVLIKLGIYLFVNKARVDWEPPRIVISQLFETKIS